jgi:uncharacterized protein YndB with AHSA1/START domain
MINSESLHFAQKSGTEIEITRRFNTTAASLYRAYVHPEILRTWLRGPQGWRMITCVFDAQPGGNYCYQWRNESGEVIGLRGQICEITPNEKIVITEEFDQSWYPGHAIVTTTFAEVDSNTTLMKTIIKYENQEAMMKVLNSGMEQGISVSYNRLEEWFSTKH